MVDLLSENERNLHLPGKPSIGTARNAGCEAARGAIIAHFDDDDWSAPTRLADQVGRLLASPGCQVTGYREMRFTDGCGWWIYSGPPRYALGTSLVYRRDWWLNHRFPEVMVGEDAGFSAQSAGRGVLVSVEAGETMWATIHPGNTSPRQMTGSSWRKL